MGEFTSKEVMDLAGMMVLLAGEDRQGPETFTLPSGLLVNTSNALPLLVSACRALDLEHMACQVAEISAMRFDPDRKAVLESALASVGADPRTILRDYQMALALKIAIGDPERENFTDGKKGTVLDLARLCRLVTGSRCDADLDKGTFSVPSFLVRMAHQQYWDQEGLEFWPRGLMILREMAAHLSPTDRYDINAAFENIYHLPFDSFVVMSFALHASVVAEPGKRFGVEQFLRSPDFDLPEDQLETFFDLISCSLEEFQDAAADPAVCFEGHDLYNLNPLMRWPAVRHSEGGVVVPIPRLLLDRVTAGIYYDFMQRLTEEEAGRFGNFWGRAFEAYVGHIFDQTEGMPKLAKAEEIVSTGRVCDWILHADSVVILFECKTRGLDARAKITGQDEHVQASLEKELGGSSLAQGVAQLAESAASIRDDKRFEGCTVFPVLVTQEEIHFANSGCASIRGMLRSAAGKLTDAPVPDVQYTGINGVEWLCRAAEQGSCDPVAALVEKFGSAFEQVDMRTYVKTRYEPPVQLIRVQREFMDRSLNEMLEPFARRPLPPLGSPA